VECSSTSSTPRGKSIDGEKGRRATMCGNKVFDSSNLEEEIYFVYGGTKETPETLKKATFFPDDYLFKPCK
jgi:hypothetical protein